MYKKTTKAIQVTVKPFYLEEQSAPDEAHYVWAHWVRIENFGEQTVQLRNRHWRITDAMGRVHEVRGDGVVGGEGRGALVGKLSDLFFKDPKAVLTLWQHKHLPKTKKRERVPPQNYNSTDLTDVFLMS